MKPFLDLVSRAIPNRFFELDLTKCPCLGHRFTGRQHFPAGRRCDGIIQVDRVFRQARTSAFAELLDQFEGKGATGTFVAINGGRHENKVRSNEVLH